MLVRIVALLCFLFLAQSVQANPLLGTWKVESIKAGDLITQVSLDRYKSLQPKEISFTEKEMGVKIADGRETRVPVEYRENENKGWSFSVDGKEWNEITVKDADTLLRTEKKAGGQEIVYTLKRLAN